MKIISGKYKGRNILGFNIEGTRPTQDRVKENLFNIINEDIKDKVVLDLFAGSGNLGLEALSREAKFCYFNDSNKKAINTINKNIKTMNIDNCKVLNMNYKKALDYFRNNNTNFDIVFLDPPYNTNYIEDSISLLNDLVKENGIIICESNDLDKVVYDEKFDCVKQKKYGDKYIVILKKI